MIHKWEIFWWQPGEAKYKGPTFFVGPK